MPFLTDDTRKHTLSDTPLRRKRRALVEQGRATKPKRRSYTDTNKVELVKTYLALGGNLSLTAGSTGIPYKTLEHWKHTSWFKGLVQELRKEYRLTLSAKTQAILDRSLDQLLDRVENGDTVFNVKTGEMMRKPVNGRELAKIAVDIMDRKEKIDKSLEDNTAPESNEDKMHQLAARFAALAVKAAEKQLKIDQGVVEDVEFREVPDRSGGNGETGEGPSQE